MTLTNWLLQEEWKFYEKGMQSEFNYLKAFANSLPGANITISAARPFGGIDFAVAADVATVVPLRTNAPGWGSGQQQVAGTNTRPPTVDQP